MAPRAAFYNPDEVLIYLAGIIIQGFAPGEFIAVEQIADDYEDESGTDGEVCRTKVLDGRVKVTLKLMQTSITNGQLSALRNSGKNSPNGGGVGTFSMQDLSSKGTICKGEQAWIKRMADTKLDRVGTAREWTIMIASGDRTEAGH